MDAENILHFLCNYCGRLYWGGTTTMKNHVAGTHDKVNSCSQIQKDVRMKF